MSFSIHQFLGLYGRGLRLFTTAEIIENICAVGEEGVRVQCRNGDVGGLERGDLIAHQGEQRRYDNCDAMINDSW